MECKIFDEKYGNVCRTCLLQSENNRFVFSYETNSVSLVDMLKDCASVEIVSTDKLPKVLCETCINQITNFYSFKLICQETEKKLLNLFKQSFETFSDSQITVKCELNDELKITNGDNHEEDKSVKELETDSESESKSNDNILDINEQWFDDSFQNEHQLKKKRRTKADKIFKCEQCTLSFYTEHRLLSHKELHFERPFKCNDCEKSFADKNCLITHSLSHENKCTICLKKCESAIELDKHFTEEHNQPGRKYQCTECNKQFSQITSLKLHIRIHTGEKPYLCTYCGKSFSLKGNLATHILMHTGEKPHSCPYCDKCYTRPHSLKAHILTHKEKKFVCKLCNKSYKWRKSLEHHMNGTHAGVRKYACTLCDKKFQFNHKLRRHMESHSGIKRACTVCGKNLSDLRKHYKKAHGITTMKDVEHKS